MGEAEQLIESNQSHDRKATNKRWVVAFVFAASQAMICKGLGGAISGPTLHYLAVNTNSSIGQVSSILSGRAVGVGSGAVAFSFFKSKFKDARLVTSSGIALFVLGMVFFVTPFIRSLILLVILHTIGGFMVGYSETGLTSLCLSIWGPAHSRPFIQLNHFMFGIGGFVAPLFAEPFLKIASQQQDSMTTCPRQEPTLLRHGHFINDSKSSVDYGVLNPVSWPYFIIGIYTIAISMLFCIIAACKVEDKLYEFNDEKIESRPEGSVKELWMFFVSVVTFSFFCNPSGMVYQAYLYSTVVSSNLKMTTSKASLLNSLFWGGFVIGRGSAVITSKYVKPSIMIKADILGTTSAMVMISIWGETSATVFWIGTFVHGFFVATLLPSVISWCSQVTNMTGKYLFLFLLGGNIGNAVLVRIGGAVFQVNPFSVIYLVTGFCVANAVCFTLMNLFAKNSKSTHDKNSSERE